MNLRNRIIIEDYRKNRADFLRLGDLVHEKLQQMVKAAGMQVLGIEHRVKSESSLAGKLERSGDWYQDFSDLTDILGERVICFFNDEVDAVGKMVEDTFYIYRDLSSDKRALIKEDSFGYLSLHYICALPENAGYPENLCGKKFEIQIRTVLQHTWAAINHDLGYKSEFGVPREYARELSRIAGLLEIADDEFMRVRDGMNKYAADIKLRIEENRADDVALNTISLTEYLARNKKMLELINKIASISGAEVRTIDCESYLIQLKWFGVNTLGDLQSMTERNFELAFQLAQKSLSASDIDILSSVAGLRFVCRAELLSGGYTQEQAADFLKISTGNAERAERLAKRLFQQYRRITEKEA
ncbi:MAG: hypothetical protein PUC05_01810 [Firmicutes bacterium]|nr:hypothetical protein [Bacillota bacterium]